MTFAKLMRSIFFTSLLFPVMILMLGGSMAWIEGWIFSLWFVTMIISTIIYMYIKDPELLAERRQAPGSGNQKKWDVYILYAILVISIIWFIIMPLDAKRFGWSPKFPLWLKMVGGLALGVLGIITIVIRTFGEEKMLLQELEGYYEYRKKVKYRLLPFIW